MIIDDLNISADENHLIDLVNPNNTLDEIENWLLLYPSYHYLVAQIWYTHRFTPGFINMWLDYYSRNHDVLSPDKGNSLIDSVPYMVEGFPDYESAYFYEEQTIDEIVFRPQTSLPEKVNVLLIEHAAPLTKVYCVLDDNDLSQYTQDRIQEIRQKVREDKNSYIDRHFVFRIHCNQDKVSHSDFIYAERLSSVFGPIYPKYGEFYKIISKEDIIKLYQSSDDILEIVFTCEINGTESKDESIELDNDLFGSRYIETRQFDSEVRKRALRYLPNWEQIKEISQIDPDISVRQEATNFLKINGKL